MTSLNSLVAQASAATTNSPYASSTSSTASLIARDSALLAADKNLGQYYPYDSAKPPVEIAGTRIVKCTYKAMGDKPAARANSFVYVPAGHLTEESVAARIADLAPFLVDYLNTVEDGIIKAEHKAGLTSVYTDRLSIDSLVEHLEVSIESGRVTKEVIGDWFDNYLYNYLAEGLAVKIDLDLSNPDEGKLIRLEKILVMYRNLYCSLAGGKTIISEDNCKAMIKAISECTEASETMLGKRFIGRLDKMASKTEEVLLSI